MTSQMVTKLLVVNGDNAPVNQQFQQVALFDSDGDPVVLPTNVTGDDVPMTGYEIAVGAAAVADTDSVNEAVGKVEFRLAALETSEAGEVDSAAEVRGTVLTGLSLATATDVVDTDSILVAIGKLQAQINAL